MAIQKKDRKRARAVMKQFELDEAERVQKHKDKAWMMYETECVVEVDPSVFKRGLLI